MSAGLDSKVAELLDENATAGQSDDEDALIADLESDDDPVLSAFREKRLQQLHEEMTRAKQMRDLGTGTYSELGEEKAVMDVTTSTKLVVAHFFKPDFARCAVMDRHLEALATKHFDTKFIKINVERAPFLVTKLQIRVLPCVLAFVDGVCAGRIIGFEGLGHGDSFSTKDLESKLLESGVLLRSKMSENDTNAGNATSKYSSISDRKPGVADDDDDDWD